MGDGRFGVGDLMDFCGCPSYSLYGAMGSICGLKVVERFGLSDQTTNGGVFLKGGGGVGWRGDFTKKGG